MLSDLGPANAAWIVDAATPEKAVKLDAIPATVGRRRVDSRWHARSSSPLQTPEDAPPGYDELFALPLGERSAPSHAV